MSKKLINTTHVEGYVYESKLERKVTGEKSKTPGVSFINGILSIATDDELTNVVQVHFTYVTPTTAKGKPNPTYDVLSKIVDGKIGTVMEHGLENAGKVRIDSAIGLNEWYDTRTAGNPLVSNKRNEGGFVHTVQVLCDEKDRATFEADMVINKFTRVEADEENDQPEKGRIEGCVFDFRGAILPVTFTALNPNAINYFESYDISPKNPMFTKVRGQQVSKTVTRTIEEEGAFGETYIRNVPNSQRDYVITWALAEPYEWDSEDTLLASELSEKMADREVYLAEMKKRQDEYQASQGNAFDKAPAAAAPATETKSSQEYKF